MSETNPAGEHETTEPAPQPKPRKRAPRSPAVPATTELTVEEGPDEPAPEKAPVADEPADDVAAQPTTSTPPTFRGAISKLNVVVIAGVVAGGLIGASAGFVVGVHASDVGAGNHVYQSAIEARRLTVASDPADASVTIRATVDGKLLEFAGVIVSPDGYIVSVSPIGDITDPVTVALADGRIVPATVDGRDEATDVAVLHTNGKNLSFTDTATASPMVDDVVTVIGADGRTITTRIASAGRAVSLDAKTAGADRATAYWLPTIELGTTNVTAGSPVFTASGQLLAITLPEVTGTDGVRSAGFAITVTAALNAAERTASHTDGQGQLGVTITDSTVDHVGAIIHTVQPGTAAAKAKLQPGDIITGFNRQPVRNAADLTADVRNTAPGVPVTLTVQRGEKTGTILVTLGWANSTPAPAQK